MLCVLPLLYQAALFYIPRKIWKTCEGGLIASFGELFNQDLSSFSRMMKNHKLYRSRRKEAGHPEGGLRERGGEGRRSDEGGDRPEVLGLLPKHPAP